MAENAEDIEAKLAAFVDGELTPAERVEIETHLEANPSHRTLLQDLVLHRNLLRSLPREKAPGDCTEGFQGQLERDILLGGNELNLARRRWRIHYSPQLLSAAAIILVAVALAVIVYSVLPPHQPKAPIAQLSTEPNKEAQTGGEGASDALADARSFKIAPETLAKKGAGNATWAMNKESALGQRLETSRFGAEQFPAQQVQAQQQIAAGDMMVITVTADDVKRANEAVVNYLELNNITFTADADAVWKDGVDTLAVGRLTAAMSAPTPSGGVNINGGAIAGGANRADIAPIQTPAIRANEDQVAKRDEVLARPEAAKSELKTQYKAATAQVDEKRLAEENVALRDRPEERFAKAAAHPAPIQPDQKSAPATQPSAVTFGSGGGGYGGSTASLTISGAPGGAGALKQQQVRVRQLDENSAACVILARDMNGQQVRELTRSLSQPERNIYARIQLDRVDALRQNTLATLTEDQSTLSDHFLSYQRQPVQEAEVVREKASSNAPAALGPTTRPADQTILAIKPADAGITRSESDTNALANGTTAVGTGRSRFREDILATTQPTPNQPAAFFAGLAATQPAGARADLFTCVIVVQNTGAARGAAPATQPVAGRPTTAPATEPPK